MLNKGDLRQILLILLFVCCSQHPFAFAQSPQSFFPHHVGNLWQYRFDGVLLAWTEQLDSTFVDSSGVEFYHYTRVYHDNPPYTQVGWYAIPDSVRVFEGLIPGEPVERMKLRYKLDAQLGEAWLVDSAGPAVAQLIDTGTTQIFGRSVSYLDIQYGYLNDFPDTVWWDVRSLARGFGLIYAQLEPMGPVGLAGAIIDSVQYGFIVNVPEPVEFPNQYVLQQNFPNPFNPSTTIRFSLPHETRVRVEVFDLLGRKVRTLLDEELPRGTHSLVWDASQQASGVYYCRLQTKEIILTRAILLQK